MKKSKFLKPFSFASLALLMGAAGVFAFAPLGASPSVAGASTVDQINTKADGEHIKYSPSPLGLDPENDPVIYTTESGLEIKYGGESVSDQLASGKPLSGYPYFTMGTYSGYAVNWVISGRNTNDTVFTSAISAHLYSTWKTNNNVSSSTFTTKAKYWFNGGGYETTTPAGSAINGVVPSKSYVADVTKATKTVVGNAEIPSGCVLAISECTLGTSTYGNTHIYGNLTSGIKIAMENLYNSGLGLTTAQQKLIQSVDMYIKYYNDNTNHLVSGQKLFAMPWYGSSTGKTENFAITTYFGGHGTFLKAYAIGTTTVTAWWCSSGEAWSSNCNGYNNVWVTTDGIGACISRTNTYGVRPTGVFKF